ncbi:MAG: methylated-DNA--[protein]-cysteine S-methyltransferase [Bacteroidetes bacterium]|nr:methylated-DNA--[protein]-cysteine S-methyltransferase [Bacteroidota bacterium]
MTGPISLEHTEEEYTDILTPLGVIRLSAMQKHITSVRAAPEGNSMHPSPTPSPLLPPLLQEGRSQIEAWFARRLLRFDLPLVPAATPAQQALRAFLLALPFGRTCSYKEVAQAVGSSPRAIGGGCGRNPLPILVPCHRIVAARGALGGYSGFNGLATKTWLLAFERETTCFT